MPVPSNSRSSSAALDQKFNTYKNRTGRIKDDADTYIGSATIYFPDVREFQSRIVNFLVELDTLVAGAATNGFLDYVRAQINNPALDLVTEHATFRAQLVATISWIATNFPKDASGRWADYTTGADNSPQPATLTAGQMTAFKSQMTALAATIT